MASSPLQNGNGGTTGFKESLRFFQSQVEKDSVHSTTKSSTTAKKALTNGYTKTQVSSDLGFQTKSGVRTATSVPTVDNILSNVKNLCSARSNNNTPESAPKFSSLHRSASENFTKSNENKQSPVVFHTFDNRLHKNATVTRSEQVSVSEKTFVNEHSRKPSLLSNFNPSFECNDSNEQKDRNKNVDNASIHSETDKACDYFESRNALENDSKKTQPTGLYGKINNLSSLRTVSSSSNEYIVSNSSLSNSASREDKVVQENTKKSLDIPINRTFGQCKERLAQLEINKASTGKSSSKISEEGKDQATKTSESVRVIEWNKKGEEGVVEKQGDSFDDYDPQDFVVHKANFSDDYLEEMSEDNYSSVNEDYEVEHPRDPDIPSPDYVSDEEEEYLVQQDDSQDYDDDGEFIDNSAQYMNDPRRYIYYPEDKELEVIPEEDEEDIEDDDDMFSHEEPYKSGGFQISNPGSDDSRYINHGECDSGLTDDQRSSSSTAEECDLEDDTDSAKGSLPLQDSSNESPTCNERANMFQNVEYHKSNKRNNYPSKRIIEDYEKPKLKGKDINTIPHEAQNGVDTDEIRQARSVTSAWDPKELLDALYRLDFPNKPLRKQIRYINKEGYLEKLPSGRKKATYWNPWKTKYIKLKDGFLYCFDNNRTEKPSMTMQLMGGHVDTLENKMIGVDDQKGHYVVLRCSNEDDIESWENALQSQCAEDFVNAYTSPCLRPLPINKNVIIIDLGSCSVRAGILMSSPSLPQMFFPTVCASNKISHKKIFGIEALNPNIRKESYLTFPLHPSAKVTKYSIDVSLLPDLLKHIFKELNIYPEDYKVQLSMPRNLSLQTKLKVARILLDDFRVKGLNLTHQAILSLHAYNSKSGIIVDIGDRLDVIPIIEGYIVESGVTRLPYGGQRMIHHLKHALAEKNISVISDVETYLARYVLEQLCYVAEDYKDELQRFHTHPDDFEMSISTSHFFKGECPWEEIILDMGRFHVAEGLFTPEHWGLDNPGLHKLVYHAIQECGVDLRREMTKSIYVSGGLTLLPGFVERLEGEIDKLTPDTITPKVHASLYRYHMSYIGACQIALEEKFDDICITKQMWRKEGNTCVKKWHI